MRYILNDGYIDEVSFDYNIECKNQTCTEYTGTIPTGYTSLEEWHEAQISENKLNAWYLVDGNLTFDNAKYNELQTLYENQNKDNSYVCHKELFEVQQEIEDTQDISKSQYQKETARGKFIEIDNVKKVYPNVKLTGIDCYSYENVDLISCGKNMLPNDAISQTINGVTFTQNVDRSIKINGTSTSAIEYNIAGTSNNTSPFFVFKKDANYYLSSNSKTIKMYNYDGTNRTEVYSGTGGAINLNEDKPVTHIALSIPTGTTFDNETIYPQLEYGTSASSYEMYKARKLSIDYSNDIVKVDGYADIDLQGNELCSVGDIKDELVIENGYAKIIKRIGKVVLDGSENVVYSSVAIGSQFRINLPAQGKRSNDINGITTMSNYYIGSIYTGRTNNTIYIPLEDKIDIINNSFSNASDFKTWLSTNNVTVYYALSTPTEIDLGKVNAVEVEDTTIDGESTQEVRSGNNLFNASVIPASSNIVVSDNGKTITMPIKTSGNGITSVNKSLSELCPTLHVGDVVYLNFTKNIAAFNNFIYLEGSTFVWTNGTSRTITATDLSGNVCLYANRYNDGQTDQIILTDFRITTNNDTPYEQYGASPSPEFPSEIVSKTTASVPALIYDALFCGNNTVIGDSTIIYGDAIDYILIENGNIYVSINGEEQTLEKGNVMLFDGFNILYTIQDTNIEIEYCINILDVESLEFLQGKSTTTNKFKILDDGSIEAHNGKFSGEVTATSGSFTGSVNATSGVIGGCSISSGVLQVGDANITSINADKITSGTISGRTISGGTVSGATITGGSISISRSVYYFNMGTSTSNPNCSGLNVGNYGIKANSDIVATGFGITDSDSGKSYSIGIRDYNNHVHWLTFKGGIITKWEYS